MGRRLYVGNLSFDTMEDDLIAAFEEDGRQVVSAWMVVAATAGRPTRGNVADLSATMAR